VAVSFPWLCPYAAEPTMRRGREVLRPVVTVSLPGVLQTIEPSWALVDTGAENVLAASWLADLAGIDLTANTDQMRIGIGGQIADVTFAQVEMRLHAPDDLQDFISWHADVGFVPHWRAPFPVVLGQVGFLDRFTVTFHRGAAMLAIEDWDVFDSRFLTGPAS
jgi:hypothetical protein